MVGSHTSGLQGSLQPSIHDHLAATTNPVWTDPNCFQGWLLHPLSTCTKSKIFWNSFCTLSKIVNFGGICTCSGSNSMQYTSTYNEIVACDKFSLHSVVESSILSYMFNELKGEVDQDWVIP